MLVELENQIGFLLHDELVKVFDKGICAAAEIGQVEPEEIRPVPDKFRNPQDLGAEAPVHVRKIAEINGRHVDELHGHGRDSDLGQVLPEPQIQPFVVKIVRPARDHHHGLRRLMAFQDFFALHDKGLQKPVLLLPARFDRLSDLAPVSTDSSADLLRQLHSERG